ncbi:winged helix-turn-helix domain-containing protein [Scandinavium lactucae]|uniref:Winged helix-turn-helix domain-containing protein n=1 Tax=Scandinavium lactucae TaxID=3095028 RepID=A0ABU4QNW0_9ENTR|nr:MULTISPECIES: winged helix-turn-helix domain-containing protein [unclassified Scandinavium]MDX6041001.1 winged helix-turn-helix domain-containing protein [Scandinavium sp. V105_6]MDX6050829.1 winged helix-turn-helix domain-containing protein [Scandinavium sp. V105_1]
MKFLFNKQVIFDSDTGLLAAHDQQDDPVQISNPTKRLLVLLLQHQGEVVNREIIFKKVWDDFGMVSSNNNLNHCISKLRRILRNLGMEEEIITTVPKMGFMFQQEIEVEQCPDPVGVLEDGYGMALEPATNASAPSLAINRPSGSSLPRPALVFNWISVAVATVTLLASTWFWYINRPLDRKEVFIGEAGTCSVLISDNLLQSNDAPSFKEGVLRYARNLKPHCTSDQYLLVIKSRSFKTWSQDLSRLYIMRCGNLRDNKAEVCWSLSEPVESSTR